MEISTWNKFIFANFWAKFCWYFGVIVITIDWLKCWKCIVKFY